MWEILILSIFLLIKKNFLKIMFLFFGGVCLFLFFQFKFKFLKELLLCDKISVMFCFLSFFVIFFIKLTFWKKSYFKNFFGMNVLHLLLIFIILFFLIDKIFLFYMFFELSVFPAFLLILGWGKNPERFNAMFYLFSYTFMGSFPLLFSLVYNYKIFFSMKFFFLFFSFWKKLNNIFFFFMLLAFMMKLPLYLFHSWLPKAHVEAPTVGSMMLASLLLKMGAYGIFRFSFFKASNPSFSFKIILGWTVVNLITLGLMMFRLKDLKILMAFSSMNHMLLVMLGWYLFSKKKLIFCMMLNLGHGFISSGLFFCMGNFYEKSHSRKVLLNKGMNHLNSIFSFIWFLFLVAKSSAPTSISLYSEIGMMSHFIFFYWFGGVCLFFFMVFGGLYCMYLYTNIFHGKYLFFKKLISFEKSFNLVSFIHLKFIFFIIFFLKKLL